MTAVMYIGDAIEVMSKLPEKSVDLVISSPPFLALRSYLPADHPDKALEGGSQSTPGEYVDWLLDVVEACARVLAPHGSLCFELGDTYAGPQPPYRYAEGHAGFGEMRTKVGGRENEIIGESNITGRGGRGWPLAKSLSLIPETFRFAMVYGHNPHTGRRTEPWRLRNVIRWVRPNPPVGALGDKFRPATSELMVFCKAKDRYFDLDAVREPLKDSPGNRYPRATKDWDQNSGKGAGFGAAPIPPNEYSAGAPPLDWWNIPPGGYPGAHYAVWPPELLVKPIKAMCPEKVCRTCGEPRRRITKDKSAFDRQPELAAHIRAQREAMRISHDEINGWFGFKEIAKNWERTDRWGAAIPSAEVWPVLKERLNLSGEEFDDLVLGDRHWTDDPAEYVGGVTKPRRTGNFQGSGSAGKVDGGITRIGKTLGFSDCGHNKVWHCAVAGTHTAQIPWSCETGSQFAPGHELDNWASNWRPGLVLDPFAGTGTTLAVATGHGRDAIGIDLDARNFDLALDRVGPLILELGVL